MPIIYVDSQLDYEVTIPTSFVFSIAATQTDHQIILNESLLLTNGVNYAWCQVGTESNRSIRMQVQPGTFSLQYHARVELNPKLGSAPSLDALYYQVIPPDILPYLNPSRYCESDRLGLFASKTFGNAPMGYERVNSICDWVYRHIDYVSGSTDASSSACDVLIQRAGVCRDFAHVAISLCRALGIPARYVSGYAALLQPPDFHGFFEAYLDGRWYLFDATRLAPVSGFVRIGTGRDAADASFATIVGAATLQYKMVSAVEEQSNQPGIPANSAVSTA